jgi:hypothetical protein
MCLRFKFKLKNFKTLKKLLNRVNLELTVSFDLDLNVFDAPVTILILNLGLLVG